LEFLVKLKSAGYSVLQALTLTSSYLILGLTNIMPISVCSSSTWHALPSVSVRPTSGDGGQHASCPSQSHRLNAPVTCAMKADCH